jgi:hypothetical protein
MFASPAPCAPQEHVARVHLPRDIVHVGREHPLLADHVEPRALNGADDGVGVLEPLRLAAE